MGGAEGSAWRRCDIALLSPVCKLSVQVLKVLNSRSTVRELSFEDLYHSTLQLLSCFASLFNCCNMT